MSPNERSALMASQPMLTLEDLPESTRQRIIAKGEEIERRLGR